MNEEEMFYHAINKSVVFADNQQYIKQTCLLMKGILKTKSMGKDILILGAGNMSDISLDFFLDNFETVTLTDIDVKSIEQQLDMNKMHPKIQIRQMDYLGLSQSGFWDGLKDRILKAKTKENVRQLIVEKVKKILSYHFSDDVHQSYDVVYVSPIYTQLFYRQVEHYIRSLDIQGFKEHFINVALETLLQEMIHIIDHFNKEVRKLVKERGLIFIASDIFLLNDDEFSNKIKENIGSFNIVEKIYESYHETYGFGLGDYGLYSASKYVNSLESKWFIWNQSKHQTYAVKFCAFEKIDE